MADLKISQLTNASALAGADVAPFVQSGANVKATVQQIITAATGATGTNGETVTTSKPRFDLTQTWNNAGTTFTGLKFNATDTASAAGSLLADLQVGGDSKFKVDKSGAVTIYNSGSNWVFGGDGNLTLTSGGTSYAALSSTSGGSFRVESSLGIGWSNSGAYGAPDTALWRDGAAIIAQRNSTNAQTFRIYNTFTDASNYELGYLKADSNGFTLGTEAAGSGTKRAVRIVGPSLASNEAVSLLDMSQTWNTTGRPTALKLNVTDTASNAASLLMDLQVGGTSKLSVDKNGALVTSINASNGNQLALYQTTATTTGISLGYAGNNPEVAVRVNNSVYYLAKNSLNIYSQAICITPNVGNPQPTGASLYADGANIFAQRYSTNAQTFRLYRSFTDSSNYSRLSLGWSSSTAIVKAEGAGTGTNGNIAFGTAALDTSATVGHLMIPSCAGTATGVPADIPTGQVALVYDSTNKKLGVYDGGWIWTAALT